MHNYQINIALTLFLNLALMSFMGCRHWAKPDPKNPESFKPVENDERYMKCSDFPKSSSDTEQAHEKVVILYSSGGSGHKSAADAVERALHRNEEKLLGKGRKYQIAKVDILYGLLPNTEFFDEYMQQEKWDKLKNLVALQGIAEKVVSLRQMLWDNKIHNRIMHACDNRAPSLLISVFPIANYVFANIAKKNHIPMVILPTDYEISHFVNQIDQSENQPAEVFLGLPLLEPEVIAPLISKKMSKPIIPYCLTGYPIRDEFIELRQKIDAAKGKSLEVEKYRKDSLRIPDGAKSLMITLGGKGGSYELISQYLEILHHMQMRTPLKTPLHIIVASGGDQNLIKKLEQKIASFSASDLFKTEILGRLDAHNMALTMASVDAVLLKPGGSTISEAIMLETPMIIKSDSAIALPWEKTNMELVKRLGWGVALALASNLKVDADDLIAKVQKALQKPRNKTPFTNFQTEFPKLIEAIKNNQNLTDAGLTCVQ